MQTGGFASGLQSTADCKSPSHKIWAACLGQEILILLVRFDTTAVKIFRVSVPMGQHLETVPLSLRVRVRALSLVRPPTARRSGPSRCPPPRNIITLHMCYKL